MSDFTDPIQELYSEHAFVTFFLEDARRVGNELLVDEFEEKLKNINNEINQLLK